MKEKDNKDINKIYFQESYKKSRLNSIQEMRNQESDFARYVNNSHLRSSNEKGVSLRVLDIGGGSGADSYFFGSLNDGINHVTCVDYAFSFSLLELLEKQEKKKENLRFIKEDVLDFALSYKNRKGAALYDVIYIRWFLHAMEYNKSRLIFQSLLPLLKSGGVIFAETRSLEDKSLLNAGIYDLSDKSYYTDHKRWPYSKEMIDDITEENKLRLDYIEESDCFSLKESEKNEYNKNPILIRTKWVKDGSNKEILERASCSDNFLRYKDSVNLLNKNINNNLFGFKKLLLMFNDLGIGYTLVGGSLLGLIRHGGFIPWDNDLDLGLDSRDWECLSENLRLFEKSGYSVKKIGRRNRFIKINNIDCFLLKKRKKSNILSGQAGVLCSEENYNKKSLQLFSGRIVSAPLYVEEELSLRYGSDYYTVGNMKDNYHNNLGIRKNNNRKEVIDRYNFELNDLDRFTLFPS